MSFVATSEQGDIIDAPLGPQCVIACAGSGKTSTAVRRLVSIRQRLGYTRGYVALLSYSNTAVDTFRSQYTELAATGEPCANRVHIATVDSFITTQIILPHAARLMGCSRRPFLVHGHESLLGGHTVFNGTHGVPIASLRVSIGETGAPVFSTQLGYGAATTISPDAALAAIRKLSSTGAYTYQTGRYWAWRALQDDGRLGAIVGKRFPHILIDEAQDIGSLHGSILRILRGHGVHLSLIGDAHQAIFEFADADGSFLTSFAQEVGSLSLTLNRRSVAPLVSVVNKICGTTASSARSAPNRPHGAYAFRYDPNVVSAVHGELCDSLISSGYAASEAVILCRGRALLEKIGGGVPQRGQGATERFVLAAMARDRGDDVRGAFSHFVDGISALLAGAPKSLRGDLLDGTTDSTVASARRVLWRFFRDPVTGLPSAALLAKSLWQPQLKARLPALLAAVSHALGCTVASTWSKRVTVAGLGDVPLLDVTPKDPESASIPIKTVHDVKGEGIPAVVYLAKKGDLESLLKGPTTEDGRVGYVAITRARDLLLIGVPKQCEQFIAELATKGVAEWKVPLLCEAPPKVPPS